MSEGSRAIALQEAVKVGAQIKAPPLQILEIAAQFEAFIYGSGNQISTAAPPAAKTEKAEKIAKLPPKPKEPEVDYKKIVGDKVNALLKANKRPEAVELLASFNGAKSATAVIEQGADTIKAFLEGADAILADTGLAD